LGFQATITGYPGSCKKALSSLFNEAFMDPREVASRIGQELYEKDEFGKLLGIKLQEISPGRSVLAMNVREDMVNGFGVVHGGAAFSLADSALAFACNSHGRLSMALEISISYPVSVQVGDVLTAIAEEVSLTNKIGIYSVMVTNQNGQKVAIFKGTVYRTTKEHNLDTIRTDY